MTHPIDYNSEYGSGVVTIRPPVGEPIRMDAEEAREFAHDLVRASDYALGDLPGP